WLLVARGAVSAIGGTREQADAALASVSCSRELQRYVQLAVAQVHTVVQEATHGAEQQSHTASDVRARVQVILTEADRAAEAVAATAASGHELGNLAKRLEASLGQFRA